MSKVPTASQTVGPFFSIGFSGMCRAELVPHAAAGAGVTVRGRVLDGEGNPVPDAVLEIWHADRDGKYDSRTADETRGAEGVPPGFGRVATNDQGEFRFTTRKPGAVRELDGRVQAPHLAVVLFMRGLLRHLVTRIYFTGESANAMDLILNLVPPERRATLLAVASSDTPGEFVWDIRLQGERETVFFAV
jgi:protocatechuate 3,4-dioxygenase, alpha subunit